MAKPSNQTIHFRAWAGGVAVALCHGRQRMAVTLTKAQIAAGHRAPGCTSSPNAEKVTCKGCLAKLSAAAAAGARSAA